MPEVVDAGKAEQSSRFDDYSDLDVPARPGGGVMG
jgi:hypothetical protein